MMRSSTNQTKDCIEGDWLTMNEIEKPDYSYAYYIERYWENPDGVEKR